MTESEINPWAPPESGRPDSATGSGFWIEKRILVLKPPYQFPPVCFLSGTQEELTECRFSLRVMPQWCSYAFPIFFVGCQVIVIFGRSWLRTIPGIAPVWMENLLSMGFPLLMFAVILPMTWFLPRTVNITAWYSTASLRDLNRKEIRQLSYLLAIVGAILIAVLFVVATIANDMTSVISMAILPAILVGLVVVIILFVARMRKPWSRIRGVRRSDGQLAILGASEEFCRVCRHRS